MAEEISVGGGGGEMIEIFSDFIHIPIKKFIYYNICSVVLQVKKIVKQFNRQTLNR